MKGAKITKRILSVMRITGVVLILVALVLALYAVINTNAYWSKIDGKTGKRVYESSARTDFGKDMHDFGVNTSVFTSVGFDGRYFGALSTAVRENKRLTDEKAAVEKANEAAAKAAADSGLAPEDADLKPVMSDDEILSAVAGTTKPFFADYYALAAEKDKNEHRVVMIERTYEWFEGKVSDDKEKRFDAARFAEANYETLSEILEYHEIEDIFKYFSGLYKAKKALGGKKLEAEDPQKDFDGHYQVLRHEHGEEEVGSRFEFLSTLKMMAERDLESGYGVADGNRYVLPGGKQAKDWYNERFDYDTYLATLAEFRGRDEDEAKENFLVGLLELCKEEADGGTPDYRAYLKKSHQTLIETYPDNELAKDEYVYLLSVRALTETLLPKDEAEIEAEAEAAAEEAAADDVSAEAGSEEAATAEAIDEEALAEMDDEAIELALQQARDEEIKELANKRSRFDGSYSKIINKMTNLSADLERNNPAHREQNFAVKLAEEAQIRSSIGVGVSVFWSVVAKYLLIFFVGLGLILVAVFAKRLMDNILVRRGVTEDEKPGKETIADEIPAQGIDGGISAEDVIDAQGGADDVLLRVSHLKQYFRSGSYVNKAVDDISFYIKKGEVFGLVGESGCGKTTTGRTIINLYDPTDGDVYFEGLRISSNMNGYPVLRKSLDNEFKQAVAKIRNEARNEIANNPGDEQAIKTALNEHIRVLREQLQQKKSDAETNAMISQIEQKRATHYYRERRVAELTEAFERESRNLPGEELAERERRFRQDIRVAKKSNIMNKMQMIFQDPIASINPRMTVREIIAEGLVIQGIKDKKYINEKVYEMLEMVGLVREHADRYPHEFSGGQRQRIGIARAIIMNPDLIIADEPISALDVSIQAQVINLLNDLRNRMGLTIMFIAHNLSVVKYFSDRIAVMYYGKIVEMTTSDELFRHPLHPYTKSLLSAIPYPDPNYEKKRKRIEYNPAESHDYSVDKPSLREIVPGHFIYCNDAEFAAYEKELAQ